MQTQYDLIAFMIYFQHGDHTFWVVVSDDFVQIALYCRDF